MTALRLLRVLDVLTSTSPRPNRRAPCPHTPSRPLASQPVEISRLAGQASPSPARLAPARKAHPPDPLHFHHGLLTKSRSGHGEALLFLEQRDELVAQEARWNPAPC